MWVLIIVVVLAIVALIVNTKPDNFIIVKTENLPQKPFREMTYQEEAWAIRQGRGWDLIGPVTSGRGTVDKLNEELKKYED